MRPAPRKQFAGSPFFYLAFTLASAIVHYLLIASNACDIVEGGPRMHLYIPPAAPDSASLWSPGPLIFSYYKPFAALFRTPATGFYTGSALLAATLTFALLRFFANVRVPGPVLYGLGIWSVISPATVMLAARQPHILLGIIFLLLIFIALLRHKNLLVLVFVIHLFLTHQALGFLSLILLAAYLALNKKRTIWHL